MTARISELLRIHLGSQGLNQHEIESISRVASVREYDPGEVALSMGETASAVSLIISGRFSLSVSEDPASAFGYLRPNDQIGVMLILQDSESSANVIAAEPSVVIEIDAEAAKVLLSDCKVFARNLLSRSNAHMTQTAIDGGRSNRPQRIAFIHVSSSTQDISKQIQKRLCEIGESVGRIINEKSVSGNNLLTQCPTLKVETKREAGQDRVIREQLSRWRELDRVVFDVHFQKADFGFEPLQGLLSFAERVFILATPETAEHVIGPAREALEQHPEWKDKLNLIWVLDDRHDVAPLMPELTSCFHRDFKIKIPANFEAWFQRTSKPGVERVVHNLRGVNLGLALVDGGYLNNVPADTLVRNGANFVMAVDVTTTIAKRLGRNFPDTPTEQMKTPRIHQVLSRIREVTQRNLSLMGGSQADFSIAPDVSHVHLADFKSTPKTAQIGYEAGLAAIPQLKAKLHKLDPELFPQASGTDACSTRKSA